MVQKNRRLFNLQFFIKCLILSIILKIQTSGNKEVVEIILKQNLSSIKKLLKQNPIFIMLQSLKRVKPYCEIKTLKISGKIFRIPVEIKSIRQKTLSIKWLIISSVKRNEFFIEIKLSKELIDSYRFYGKTVELCENFHKTAEINKIYLQYRF